MSALSRDAHVADLVLEQPGRARVFERHGIDYCCGGQTPLANACAERGLDVATVLAELESSPRAADERDWSQATSAALAAHIVDEHHAYLREELPLLRALVDKVARAHGDRHADAAMTVRGGFAVRVESSRRGDRPRDHVGVTGCAPGLPRSTIQLSSVHAGWNSGVVADSTTRKSVRQVVRSSSTRT